VTYERNSTQDRPLFRAISGGVLDLSKSALKMFHGHLELRHIHIAQIRETLSAEFGDRQTRYADGYNPEQLDWNLNTRVEDSR
jgi:hypothetical protein